MAIRIGGGANVAVVEMHGIIGTQINAVAYAHILDEVAHRDSYKALLLDINSPGGSASDSEVLHRSIERVAEKKPVVAYVRSTAASGGYYLCCAASQVFALPTALVGSIGVIYLRPVIEQLLSRVGVEFSVFKSGKYKDMSGFWRNPTSEEAGKFQELIDEVYENFIQVVVHGRSMTEDAVRELATGEVMTGQGAVNAGLIDKIGDYTDALEAVAKEGKCKTNTKLLKPKTKLLDRLPIKAGMSASSMNDFVGITQRLMCGGMYYMDPAHLTSLRGGY